MARLKEDQLEQIRNERKEQILAAAIKVFAENGLRLTKISEIAAEAGISHGLLYHYFKSKDEVLHASLEWAMAGTEELLQEIADMSQGPLGKLRQFTIIALTEGNSDVFRVIQHLNRANFQVPEPTRELVKTIGAQYIEQLLPLFVQGQAQGELLQTDAKELLELYLTVISGLLTEYDIEWWNQSLDRRVDLLLRMITAR